MRPWLLFALAGLGCAAARPVTLAPVSSRVEVPTPEDAPPREALLVPRPEAAPNRCLPKGLPAASKRRDLANGATCRDHGSTEGRLRAILTKGFQKSANGRVDVVFGCDPVAGELTELSFETGYGHGGSLTLWRLKRPENGSVFDVLGIANDEWITPPSELDRATSLQVTRGVLPVHDLERARCR